MKKLIILSIILILGSVVYSQTDQENSKDYNLLDRMPGYFIVNYSESNFDAHGFYIEHKKQIIEGKKYVIEYRHTEWENKDFIFPERIQILRNYSNAIVKAGGDIVTERHNFEWGHYSFITGDNLEIWVEVKPKGRAGKDYKLTIIEREKMRQDIVIDSELIKNKIELDGKITFYGIYFDVGKAVIKNESTETLDQIAEFLISNPSINCWVVGHTDSDGSFKLNSELSLDRAKAIKSWLQNHHKIAHSRLFAEGVGPLAPVGSNSSEQGKKLNRRVELVKK